MISPEILTNYTMSYGGTSVTISLNNSKVSISDDGKLLTLICEYTKRRKGYIPQPAQ